MKRKLLLMTGLLILLVSLKAQTFQESFEFFGNNFHSVCTDQLSDASNDIVVAGTYFSDVLDLPKIQVIRMDEITGNIIWQYAYHDFTQIIEEARAFDFIAYEENSVQMLALTGSVMIAGTNYAFIIKMDDSGNYVSGAYYSNLVPGTIHSQGLHIIYSQQGFVVGGFANVDYIDSNNDPNSGFILKTDLSLNPLWAKEVSSGDATATDDFDMVNHILETDDGYFVTGSVNSPTPTQQSVLCLKLDFIGNDVWDNSYVFGNARDVGVDAYYDAGTDEVFLLSNFSQRHYFSVTVLDDNSGLIDFGKSWVGDAGIYDRYGFAINESVTSTSNLLISGYMRDGQVRDQNGVLVYAETIPFAYEFEKATGDQVGKAYFYDVPFTPPAYNDYFDFWNSQMPLIYYPDMAINLSNSQDYFQLGYRTGVNGYAEIELIKINALLENPCYQTEINLGHTPITVTPVAIATASLVPVKNVLELDQDINPFNVSVYCEEQEDCDCDQLTDDMAMGFTYTNTGLTVNFTPVALSANCDSVEWNFGDNSALVNSQGNQTVTHTYAWPEFYDVCMKVTRYMNDGTVCTDSICKRIDLLGVGVYSNSESSINIWPNPVKDLLYISSESEQHHNVDYQVVNMMGEIVLAGKLAAATTSTISTHELATGLYIIQVTTSKGILTRKFLKE
jgi:hypothetical protein